MTWNQMYTLATVGTEHEYYFSSSACQSIDHCRRVLSEHGFDYLEVKGDGTYEVDVEIVFPPLPLVPEVRAEYSRFMEVCVSLGLKYRERCGLHVHIGKRRLKPATDIAAYIEHAKDRFRNGVRLPDASWFCEDGMHFELIKDVFRRYSLAQEDINAILPPARRQSRGMVKEISRFTATPEARQRLDNCTDIDELQQLVAREAGPVKYWAINLGLNGTVEFRQHPASTSSHKAWAWCQFVVDLFEYSDNYRLSYNLAAAQEIEQTVTTPEAPYRRNSNMDLIWRACRIEGGAPVRQLINLTGLDADTIRPRISEMRSQHGHDAILTHTQQAYNHRYGESNGRYDLGGYEVQREYTRTITTQGNGDGVGLLPVEERANINIWGDLSHEVVEFYERAARRRDGVVAESWSR